MYQYKCMNQIAKFGLDHFTRDYAEVEEIEEADALLVRSAALHDMEFPKNLKTIARAGAGVNNIPLGKCAEQGIVVFNTPGANANGVKELVLAGLLLAARDIIGGVNWVQSERMNEEISKLAEKQKKQFAGHEIEGKKLGIIGLGAIGALVANTAIYLGMEVYGYDPYISIDTAWKLSREIRHISNVDEIFRDCDYITLHLPQTPETKNMINGETLGKMKDSVRLLNFARGGLVDTDALLAALAQGKVAAYATDFPADAMIGVENIVAIPHLGASTPESEDNCARMAVDQLKDYLENGNILNSVNLPSVSMAREPGTRRVCLIHKNVPNTIAMLAAACGEAGINIENMQSKSRGEYAYTILDVSGELTKDAVDSLRQMEPMIKARVIV